MLLTESGDGCVRASCWTKTRVGEFRSTRCLHSSVVVVPQTNPYYFMPIREQTSATALAAAHTGERESSGVQCLCAIDVFS